jgi:1-acyl-sn-glycerol-3-phosphate acyltransferase
MSFLALYSRLVSGAYRWLWLGRIDSTAPRIPPGSVILAAHYNGAIDGFTYGSQLPPFLAVVSAQWHRMAAGRLLVPGLSVQRAKDGVSGSRNLAAFRDIMGRLRVGERVLFFPEGTSRLGPDRLPVQPGTLLLLRQARRQAARPEIFFTAASYHQPTLWRSSVSIAWTGPRELPESPDRDNDWVRAGLQEAQAAAGAMPVPPSSGMGLMAPLAALPFLPAWLLASRLSARVADDENVIALWKFIFGAPLTLVFLAVLTFVSLRTGWPWWLPLCSLAAGWILWEK